jgi:hypothetical protein
MPLFALASTTIGKLPAERGTAPSTTSALSLSAIASRSRSTSW